MKAVHYVDHLETIEGKITEAHTSFRVGGITKSIVTDTDIFKSATGLGGKDVAYECLYLWKQNGWSGAPSSPVSFFRNVHDIKTNMKAGTNEAIKKYFHGGWIQNFSNGFHHGDVYLYDIVKAYYWAGSLGLPTRSVVFFDKPKSENFIAVVKIKNRKSTYPTFLQKDETIITGEDLEMFDIDFEYKYGFDLYDYNYFPESDIEKLNYLPEKVFKLLKQSYWGLWAMQSGVKCIRITKDGELKEWMLYNRNKKLIWAIIIIHRVIQNLYNNFSDNVLNVYVDSILTKGKILNEGDQPGKLKLKNKFNGVYVKNAGLWTSIENYLQNQKEYSRWIKHAGYKSKL